MKKILLLALAAILSSGYAFSRDKDYTYYGVSFDFGLNFIDNARGFSLVEDVDAFPMEGFDVGFYMQQQLYKRMVLVTGFKYQFSMGNEYSKSSIGQMELDRCDMFMINHAFVIPIKLGFSTPLPRNWFFSVFAGPSLDFNFATTEKLKFKNDTYQKIDWVNGKYKSDIDGEVDETSSELKSLKMFDIPIGFGFTFRHKFVGIKFEYEYGLIDRCKDNVKDNINGAKWNSHQVSLGAVFVF
ncbi:MAG: PorT family protein [Paludibacteraceae bacterium]|nr:PorT family protein [Paludibacteraceae bacterium]